MLNMSLNGVSHNLIEEHDLQWKLEMYFAKVFDTYLQSNYGITEVKFKEIIKNLAPEEFV